MPQLYSYFDPSAPDVAIQSLFSKYDENNSGTLEFDELHKLLVDDIGLYEEHAEMYMMLLDKDANGSINRAEFLHWFRSGERLKNAGSESRFDVMQKAIALFQYYDRDGNGWIDEREFGALFADIGGQPQGLRGALKTLDSDGNGKISFYEFVKWLNWLDMGAL